MLRILHRATAFPGAQGDILHVLIESNGMAGYLGSQNR